MIEKLFTVEDIENEIREFICEYEKYLNNTGFSEFSEDAKDKVKRFILYNHWRNLMELREQIIKART